MLLKFKDIKPVIFSSLILLFIAAGNLRAAGPMGEMKPATVANKLLDQAYGKDPQQRMDIYLPKKRTTTAAKVFIVIHGGGWFSGDKADLNSMVGFLKSNFPNHAIVNINYRLGTQEKPGFPRQIEDIERAIAYLDGKHQEYNISKRYAMIGTSAGGHLAMLYSYRYNTENKVSSVCSIVAPTDFSDSSLKGNVRIDYALRFFIGKHMNYTSNPKIYNDISPAKHITSAAPPTLLIHSSNDPFVPNTQGKILIEKLNAKLVYNEYYKYDNAGHANWSRKQQSDIDKKMKKFFSKHF